MVELACRATPATRVAECVKLHADVARNISAGSVIPPANGQVLGLRPGLCVSCPPYPRALCRMWRP